ncbi:Mitochondrial distribution and morphology protein 31, mitochondrial precursor [Tulasnella sp. JGI-2019a]|nr:Mitochondrial distribution and morphology protein 31, mitochondrial precursor [Tulasnella sp. JGI-2019a]
MLLRQLSRSSRVCQVTNLCNLPAINASNSDAARYLVIRAFFTHSGSRRSSADSVMSQDPCLAPLRGTRPPLARSEPLRIQCRCFSMNGKGVDSRHEQSSPSKGSLSDEAKTPGTDQLYAPPTTEDHIIHWNNYPRFLKRLAQSLPNSPHLHRPTRDELLNVAGNMWDRFRIRFKWFTIRGFRKFNADDISAFFSWFLVGNTLLLFIATTTSVSIIFFIANSLQMQSSLARTLSDYLTTNTGIQIVFESAIVPRWKDSRICFENVYVSRRPGARIKNVKASEGHRQATRLLSVGDHTNDPYHHHHGHEEYGIAGPEEDDVMEDHLKDVAHFDLNIDSITVTLSLWRWWNGKGLVTDAQVRGVRGVVDCRHLTQPIPPGMTPASTRYIAQPGDFQLEGLQLEDILVTIYQPNFRPFTASIFRADLDCLRSRWLFYDLMSAESMVGQFDNCLFSLHQPQSINRTRESDAKDATWKRMSRFRIDGVNVDHIQNLTDTSGPIAWIVSGKVDAVLDIRFGRDPDREVDIPALLGEIAANLSAAATGSPPAAETHPLPDRIPGQRELARPALTAPSEDAGEWQKPTETVIDIDLRFRDLKAAVPIFTHDISYVQNALIRPIVAFIK